MQRKLKALFISVALVCISTNTYGHGRWVLPSHFNLSGTKPHTITVDMSISNELFNPDHGFMSVSENPKANKGPAPAILKMLDADGLLTDNLDFQYLVRKSVGAIPINGEGTQHIYLAQAPVEFRTFEHSDGKHGKAFNPNAKLPAGVKNVQKVRMLSTINTYVSRNGMTTPATIKKGLELANGQHPNDLFVGETTKFQVLFNRITLQTPIELQLVQGETRYRNDRQTTNLKTDDQGWFSITWRHPGVYLIEAEYDVNLKDDVDITKFALYTTLEVNPE